MNETKKMMEIIHQNRNKVYNAKINKLVKEQKKEDRKFKIFMIVVAILFFTTLFAYSKYNQSQIDKCMEAGNSENFCTYAGE